MDWSCRQNLALFEENRSYPFPSLFYINPPPLDRFSIIKSSITSLTFFLIFGGRRAALPKLCHLSKTLFFLPKPITCCFEILQVGYCQNSFWRLLSSLSLPSLVSLPSFSSFSTLGIITMTLGQCPFFLNSRLSYRC